jgi:8-oxo-dGTP pyrophosphatase MutT (NUDIX family)
VWADGTMPLQVRAYVSDIRPPAKLVSSVRCVLLRGSAVMVIEDFKGEQHVLPGGRVEAGEALAETLQRELVEETGWTAHEPMQLGFTHFHHLNPAPDGYRYPHPDFLQIIYTAAAGEHLPDQQEQDSEWEAGSSFLSLHEALLLDLDPINRAFLEAARSHQARHRGPDRS